MKIMEFLAGKMRCEGKMVIPDTRKGRVRIARGDESLLHFQWIDRVTNVVEDDQIVFPDEAVFEKVNQASGRVYILKFNTDDRKFFFWMQEPSEAGDPQLCDSVNYCINQALDHTEEESDASIPVKITEDMDDDHDENISFVDGSLASTSVGAEVSNPLNYSPGPVKLEDLERILNNIESEIVEDKDHGIGLGDILKPDLIIPLVETLPLDQYLASYLPEGDWNSEELINLLQSPQVRQQIDFFTYVLQTGQIDLTQFGIDPTKYKFSVLSFLEALEDSVSSSTSEHELEKDLRSPSCKPMDEHQ